MLLTLPNEILVLILSSLDFKDLVACKSVGRTLNSVVNNALVLRYTLTLAAYGLRDNIRSVKPVGEKLQRAHLFHRALRDIRWTTHFTLHSEGRRLDHPSSPIIFRDMADPGELTFLNSGSALRDVTEQRWRVVPPPSSVYTCTFNAAEDLTILQTDDVPKSRFHLLTMSGGDPHPEAGRPFLEGETIALDSTTFGPYIFIHGLGDLHTLWNWKTGEMITRIRCYYYAVAFLDFDHIALVAMSHDVGMALHVYRIPFTIYDQTTGRMHPAHFVLGLPTLRAKANRDDHTLCSLKRGFSLPPATPVGDFFTDPDDVLMAVEFAQLTPPKPYELFVPLRVIRNLLKPVPCTRYVPWASWGPQCSHATPLLRYPPIVGWRSHSTFGLRRIGMYPTQRDDDVMVAKLYDYSPRRVALARQEEPAEDGRWRIVDGETVDGDWLGGDELQTHLSHIETEIPLPEELQRHRGSLITLGINDDGIVACTNFEASRPNVVHIYTI